MHTPRIIFISLCLLFVTGSSFAQDTAAPAPAGATPPAAAPAQPAAMPTTTPAAAEPAAPVPTEVAGPAAPPPPPPAGAGEPPPPPPPPTYRALGGEPEVQQPEGEWNPWDHPAAGSYEHEGFFLRLTLGFGGGSNGNSNVTRSGPTLGMGLAIGGAIVSNLVLHADFQNTLILSPSEEVNGKETNFDNDLQMSSIGIGVTYFFMPVNLYLTGSLGIGETTFENAAGQQSRTKVGPTLNVMLGKEWWVASEWGVGVALQLLVMRVDDRYDGKLTSGALNLLFSATYN